MQLLINILISTSIYLLIANSVLITYSTTEFLNLAHAITISIGAYFVFLFSKQLDFPLFISIPISITISVIFGFICEKSLFRFLRKNSSKMFILLIASLGVYIIFQNLISIFWGNDTLSIRMWKISVGHEFMGGYITNLQITIIAVSLLLFLGTILLLKYSGTGKKIKAVSSNKLLSNIFGINSEKVIVSSVITSSIIASIAGILVAFETDITPTMGFNLLLYGIVTMIIGGVGSTWGLIGGSLLLATAQHLGAYYISSQWMDAIAYVILILFLIWKPLGFSGKRLKKVEI